MAKKKAPVVIVDEELTPTVLKTIEEKKTGYIGLLVVILIFGVTVFFLPNITELVDKVMKPNVTQTPSKPTPAPTPETPDDDNTVEIKKYPLSDSLKIEEKNFTLTNFVINENNLKLKINNTGNNTLNMDDYNYYLEMYTEDETLIKRVKMDDIIVGVNANFDLDYDLPTNAVAYFTFREIDKADYPAYTALANENGEGTLICRKENETINYILKSNKLISIEDHVEVKMDDPNYATLLTTYQSLATTYNQVTGVTASVNVEEDKFTFSTYVNLSVGNQVEISKWVYPNNTDAKIIRFELLSRGYTCN